MTHFSLRAVAAPAAAIMLATVCAASAQQGEQSSPGFLDSLFGGSERVGSPPAVPPRAPAPAGQVAQAPGSDLMIRIDRLEAQIRQLTGTIEQLQYRNQQLETALRRMQDGSGARVMPAPDEASRQPLARPGLPPPVTQAPAATQSSPSAAPSGTGRRGDAFDPSQNPNAPGAPRVLGSVPATGGVPPVPTPDPQEAPVGAPGGRAAGAPLDLSTMGTDPSITPAGAASPGDQLPAPPARNPSATGAQVAALPPSDSPKDNFDLGYGYILRKDYALAEDAFRTFLRRFPSDRLTPDAHYWLGESLFQRQRFRDAAEAFLNVSTKYETTAKAPEALLRLGQSLAALGETEAACASLAEVLRKYPRASVSVKQGVDRELKRVRC